MLLGRLGGWILGVGAAAPYLLLVNSEQQNASNLVPFETKVLPVLRAHCSSCHAGELPAAGLNLMSADGIQKGKIVIAGDPEKSKLYLRISGDTLGPRMPSGFRPLSDSQIADIRSWILSGASFQSSSQDNFLGVLTLLRARCGSCHSLTNKGGGLDLTSTSGIQTGGTSGPLVNPRNPNESVLVKRLLGHGGKPRMPIGMLPFDSKEMDVITDWIMSGASTQLGPKIHWAYRALVPQAVPAGSKNPIDAFVFARLKKEGLQPAPPATREKQLRRLYLDLIGMPPTNAQLDAALRNFSEGRYATVSEELLASPHFGEHQARYWLDLARYADTDGYEADVTRTAWKFRDWVIDAFNQNLPFDQFTIQQLAGDMLPDPTQAQLVATGFHRNSMFNREGGVDPKESRYETIVDRVNTTADVWLGSTIQCARCHDHKYDPFTQKDYFRLYAIFSNTVFESQGDPKVGAEKYYEPEIKVPSAEQLREQKQLQAEIQRLERELLRSSPELDNEFSRWKIAVAKSAGWTPVQTVGRSANAGTKLDLQADGSLLASGVLPDNESYAIQLQSTRPISGIRIEAIPDKSFPTGGSGRSSSGNFILSRIDVKAQGKPISIRTAAADFIQSGYSTSGLFDENGDTGWAVYPYQTRVNTLDIELGNQVASKTPVDLTLAFESKTWKQHVIGRFRITTTDSPFSTAYTSSSNIRSLLTKSRLNKEETVLVRKAFSLASPALSEVRKKLDSVQASLNSLVSTFPSAMILRERKTNDPLKAPVHHRGEFLSPGEEVLAGVPKFLPEMPAGAAPNRLTFAKWLVSPSNPLTARVLVNRIWAQYFGRGLVETQEDFGTQGGEPSHPELLNWLALELVKSGWNLKHIHRLIVSSQTYRQDSRCSTELRERDPDNILLARGPRIRLDAEAIRDTVLQASGLLNAKVGGPSVFPYQPDGVWNSPYSGEVWKKSEGDAIYRRGLYTFWKRTSPFPAFSAMDATSRESCTVRRTRTNTPLQALAQMNDQMIVDASKALALRMSQAVRIVDLHPGPPYNRGGAFRNESGIAQAFRSCTSRAPTLEELRVLEKLFHDARQKYWADHSSAKKLGKDATMAALVVVANVLLNLDETITKE